MFIQNKQNFRQNYLNMNSYSSNSNITTNQNNNSYIHYNDMYSNESNNINNNMNDNIFNRNRVISRNNYGNMNTAKIDILHFQSHHIVKEIHLRFHRLYIRFSHNLQFLFQ